MLTQVFNISVTKIFTFAAAHHLPNYNGKCKNVHGHNFKLFVTVKLRRDHVGFPEGMIVDFAELKSLVKDNVIDIIDHTNLNDRLDVPTAENLIILIKSELDFVFDSEPFYLSKLQLWESEDSFAEGEWGEK